MQAENNIFLGIHPPMITKNYLDFTKFKYTKSITDYFLKLFSCMFSLCLWGSFCLRPDEANIHTGGFLEALGGCQSAMKSLKKSMILVTEAITGQRTHTAAGGAKPQHQILRDTKIAHGEKNTSKNTTIISVQFLEEKNFSTKSCTKHQFESITASPILRCWQNEQGDDCWTRGGGSQGSIVTLCDGGKGYPKARGRKRRRRKAPSSHCFTQKREGTTC